MADAPTIQQALGKVTKALKAVPKGDRNKDQGYNFRGIDSVMTALHPHLADAGVVITPMVENVTYDSYSTRKGTEMRVAVVTVRYRFHGPAGDYVDAVVVGEASDTADKATNKALSAAFKYALVQTFTLPTDESDADSETHERAPQHTPRPQAPAKVPPSTEQVAEAHQALRDAWSLPDDPDTREAFHDSLKRLLASYDGKPTKLDQLSASQVEALVKVCRENPDKVAKFLPQESAA